MTQKEKIYKELERAGSFGVTNYDLNDICFRYSARIKDLRDDGHNIVAIKEKGSRWRFVLIKEPVQAELPL